MLPSEIIYDKIEKQCMKKFGCLNSDFIIQELKNALDAPLPIKRKRLLSTLPETEVRNLNILKDCLYNKSYEQLAAKYNLSSSMTELIVKRYAMNMLQTGGYVPNGQKELINLKEVKRYTPYLITKIKTKLGE